MRYATRSRWWILVLFVGLGALMTAWEPTRYTLIGPLWLLGSVLVGAFFGLMVLRAMRLQRLRRTGTPARAIATAVRKTGNSVHEMPQVEMDLQVQAPAGGYSVRKKVIVPLIELERLAGGEEFSVRIDPGNRERLAFEWPQYSEERAGWIARGGGGPETIDPAALAEEAKTIVEEPS
jgi:hypothetical protein